MGTPVTIIFFAALLTVRHAEGSGEPWLKTEKHAEFGTEVQLPCVLKLPKCGGLHSIKWYHDATRIFIFSEGVGLTRGTNEIATRSDMIYVANTTDTFLKIPNLKLEDEGLYKCEATYLAVNRECNNVQHITLTVTVKPKFVRVTDEDSKATLNSGVTMGPINEGTKIVLNCDSGEGKPVPTVAWYNGTQLLEAKYQSKVETNGTGVGSSRLEVQVTRGDLGAQFICKASSPALSEPLAVGIHMDVNVRPLRMDLNGVVDHVVKGTRVLLQCLVNGARPAANVTWYNGTDLLDGKEERIHDFKTDIKNEVDGTFETESYLVFTATQYENDATFSCHAENAVTRLESVKPMKETLAIEVLYPPIVTLKPDNITVNETEEFRVFCDYVANPATLLNVKWLRNDEPLDLKDDDHYEGGITEQTALLVKNATHSDKGTYTCVLENSVGESTTDDAIDVSVLHKPMVEVTMEPEAPVNEADRLNVSLTCDVTFGYPTTLIAVRWYLDGDLLKELPDCVRNTTPSTIEEASTFCDIDPSKLLLEAVGRSFHGNYSCEGRNEAGWGPVSDSNPVSVYYKPGPATITYDPRQVVKKGSLKITCAVLDFGRPEASEYKWLRGHHRLPDENKAVLNIETVNLETEANFTCIAYNEAGEGEPATTFVDVSAPPAFIRKLPPYHGFVYNAPNVSIECWVECAPICNISWLKDGVPMNFTNNDHYYLTETLHPPDPRTNDFESIQSTLIWNLTAWPGGHLDPDADKKRFTCESSQNVIGPPVKSSTEFHVEFKPENMTTSKKIINVVENHISDRVLCTAKAHPEPTFRWYREGTSETISESKTLIFKTTIPRRSTGNYICEASNRHGIQTIAMYMNVQFKPDCRIDKQRIEGENYLVCSATANPEETDFTWSLKSDNDTLEQTPYARDGKSYIRLDPSGTNFRTYVCVANNSIGMSIPCERDVPAYNGEDSNVPWWYRLEGDLLIIVIIVAVVLVLVIIIICIVVFLVCRRKRNLIKYNNRVVELEEREHPDGGPPSPTTSAHSTPAVQPTPAPRWPLKPGVLVHVNRTHSLRSGLSNCVNLQPHLTSASTPRAGRTPAEGAITRTPVRAYRRAKDNRRTLSMPNVHEDGMLARANRIRAMFGAQLKDSDTFPGISREKTAVTYKRIAPRQRSQHNAPTPPDLNTTNISRKRKKPGADPTQAANSNHLDSVLEGLPEPEMKTFYENLPFHGIQTPPNKLVSPKFARVSALHGTLHSATPSPCSSRPPSRSASLCGGSSGYGSTRSHLGPHYSSHNMPRSNSPEVKYNSLKPRRRKHKHTQFYSLRLCRRHQTTHHNYQLYAIPIRKTCVHKNGSTSTVATTTARSTEATTTPASTPTRSRTPTPTRLPPTPAPRKKKTDPSQHIYQNVPQPVFPQNAASTKNKTTNPYTYQEHYQQQQQELQPYGYPIASSSSSQLTLPLTRSLHHSSVVSPLQTSFTVHTNNRHSLPYQEGSTVPRSLAIGDMEMDLVHDHQPRQRHGGGGGSGGRRHDRRKYRKHSNDRKQKQRRSDSRRSEPSYAFSQETSFNQVQDLPQENFKISYPHYYEDSITECPSDYPSTNSVHHRNRDAANRYSNSSLHYADLNLCSKNRTKGRRHTGAPRENRAPSAPPTTQYAELQFRDVGQEIDV